MASFSEHIQPEYASTRKVEPIWILVKKRWCGGSGIIFTSLQTDNHASSSSCTFYGPDALLDAQPTDVTKVFLIVVWPGWNISAVLMSNPTQCMRDDLHGMLESCFVVSFLILFAVHLFWVTQSGKGHMTDKGAWHGHSYHRALAACAPPIIGLDFFETELPTWNLHYLCTVWFLFKAKFFTTVNIRCVSKKRPTFDLL